MLQDFYSAYSRSFTAVRAHTDDMKRLGYRLRYDVYCLENWLIDPGRNPGRLERDAYDQQATQILLVHEESAKAVGTGRVNFFNPAAPLASFPLQDICDHPLLHMPEKIDKLCEMSRFCMARSFRRRPQDGTFLPAYHDPELYHDGRLSLIRRRIPYAPLGLIRAAFESALERGAEDCIWTLDQSTLHSLRRIGLDYRTLGPRLRDHGHIQPIIFNIRHVLETMKTLNEPCWEIVSDRGRLSAVSPTPQTREEWHDSVFDQETRDRVIEQLSWD